MCAMWVKHMHVRNMCAYGCMQTDRQCWARQTDDVKTVKDKTDRQYTDRKGDRQKDRQKAKITDRQKNRQTDKQTDRQAGRAGRQEKAHSPRRPAVTAQAAP